MDIKILEAYLEINKEFKPSTPTFNGLKRFFKMWKYNIKGTIYINKNGGYNNDK